MKKILFIEPKSPGEHIFTKFALPRIGVFILGTMMKERGWDAEICIEEMRPFDDAMLVDVDLVGISTITPTATRAYDIADLVRGRGIPVIMGGPHATFMADEALGHVDYVIRGEGENPLMSFIDAWEGDRDFSSVPGLSYLTRGAAVHNPLGAFEKNLDAFPVCDFSLSPAPLRVIPVQTSRGCPYDCSFCSVTGMFGRGFRFRSTEHILAELRRYRDLGKMIFFYDDHFGASPARAKELLRAMIAEGLVFKFSTQVRVEVARDRELLDLMKRAGCHTLFIGLESVNPESLKEMRKKQTVEDIRKAIRNIHEFGINIHGMFVHGFDRDTWSSVRETVRFARKMKLTSTQFLILTPFPGSELHRQLGDRIVFNDWSMYDAHHVVYRPVNFTPGELQRAQIYSHVKFYSAIEMAKKFFRRRWLALGIALYARLTNRRWKRNNREYLKMLALMSRRPDRAPSLDGRPEF